jgi:hypothetical protein
MVIIALRMVARTILVYSEVRLKKFVPSNESEKLMSFSPCVSSRAPHSVAR